MVYENNESLNQNETNQLLQSNLSLISKDSSSANSNFSSKASSNSSSSSYFPNYAHIQQQVLDKRIPSEIIEMSNQFSMNYDHGYNYGADTLEHGYVSKPLPISLPPVHHGGFQSRSQPQPSPPINPAMAHRRQKSLELLRALPNRNDIYNEEYQHQMYQEQLDYQQQIAFQQQSQQAMLLQQQQAQHLLQVQQQQYMDERVGRPMSHIDPYQRQPYSPGRVYFDGYRPQSPQLQPTIRKMPMQNSLYSQPGISSSTSSLAKPNRYSMAMAPQPPLQQYPPQQLNFHQPQLSPQHVIPKFRQSDTFVPQHSRNSSTASKLSLSMNNFEPAMRKSSTETNLRDRRLSISSEHLLSFTNPEEGVKNELSQRDIELKNKHLNFVQSQFDREQTRQISDYSKFLGLDEDQQSRMPSRQPSRISLNLAATGGLSRQPSRLHLNLSAAENLNPVHHEVIQPLNYFNAPHLESNLTSNEELSVSPPTITEDNSIYINALSSNFTELDINDADQHDGEGNEIEDPISNDIHSESSSNYSRKEEVNEKEIIVIDDSPKIEANNFEIKEDGTQDQSSHDQSSQDQSVNEIISMTRSRSNSTSSIESEASYTSIVRGSSGKFKVITTQERKERIARESVLMEAERSLTEGNENSFGSSNDDSKKLDDFTFTSNKKVFGSPINISGKDDYLTKLIQDTQSSPDPYQRDGISPNSRTQFNERFQGDVSTDFIEEQQQQQQQQQQYLPQNIQMPASSYAFNDMVNQASVSNINPELIDDLQSLSNYSGESGFGSIHNNLSIQDFGSPMGPPEDYYRDVNGYIIPSAQARPVRRSFVPNYQMMNPSMEQLNYMEDPHQVLPMNYNMMNGSRSQFSPQMYNQGYQSPRMNISPQQRTSHSPQRINISDEKTSKQVEDFVTLRKLILSGQKSCEFRLKWVISLIEASRNKLYFYITIKGLPLKGPSNVNVIEQNKQQFYKSAITHLTKIINDPETLTHKKEAADSHFIYASMLSGEIPGFTAKNFDKAFSYYYNSAKYGHIHATYKVGEYLESGIGCDLNQKRALQFYARASKLGDISAKYRLALVSLNGELSQPRSINFYDYLMEVSSNPSSKGEEVGRASYELGKIYEGRYPAVESYEEDFIHELSQYAPVDDSKALFFYSKSAKQDFIKAKVKLGKVYEFGELNRPRDAKQSIQWYNESKIDPEAALGLSRWYISGEPGIVNRNHEKAFYWAQKAAESGIAEADYTMGTYYQMGIGAEKNLFEAKNWFAKAAEKGHEIAQSKIEDSDY